MIVTHPAISGGSRPLDNLERLTVELYCSEREHGPGSDTPAFREWWTFTESCAGFTGQDVLELRDYAWSWAGRFSEYCTDGQEDQDETDRDKARMYNGL